MNSPKRIGNFSFDANLENALVQVLKKMYICWYLRFHVKTRFSFLIAWLLMLQNHTADGVFDFLTTLSEMVK